MANKSEQQDQPTINIDISDAGQTIVNDATNNVKSMNLDSTTEERSGLSKDELLKFANQPFWVRLRNILFSTFWIVWLSILVAAVGYVYQNPNCNALNPVKGAGSPLNGNTTIEASSTPMSS